MTLSSNEFMKAVLKRVKGKRKRVHKKCKEIVGSETAAFRIGLAKLPCSCKDTHL